MSVFFYKQFRKRGEKFAKALDDFANWLYNNPPPGVDVEDIKAFYDILDETGEGFIEFTRLVLLSREASE